MKKSRKAKKKEGKFPPRMWTKLRQVQAQKTIKMVWSHCLPGCHKIGQALIGRLWFCRGSGRTPQACCAISWRKMCCCVKSRVRRSALRYLVILSSLSSAKESVFMPYKCLLGTSCENPFWELPYNTF